MRKLVLIATLSLLASQAYAGGSRSLSLAATNASPVTEQPATTAPPQATQAPTATNVQTATTTPAPPPPAAPSQTATTPAATASRPIAETKPKHREPSTEARVIRELHRHGIYW
ncbi:hypothetical protein AOQ71_09820 [Bradyrhizobium manausense]|uniref:Uncharacterized protein n=2 Tax=Nitrobacteraceae TaxID=41294 RepID=A0A0R3E4E2_9BRAD|nr:hypothetical protein [Bradyrhizobium manausense]KRQ15294.1 hypothetical protein AOQ71_09820 [Bradyrhizobium manausense]